MENDAWVSAEVVAQEGRPDKKLYSLTNDGHGELNRWLVEPSNREPLRSEFAVKLRALHLADRETLAVDVKRRREIHAAKLAEYEESASKYFVDPGNLPDEHVGPYLVLRGGIRGEQGSIEWCDEILNYLESR